MDATVSNNIKPVINKVIIIIMSLIYVFGPAHVEVNKLLHVLSHSLEIPDNILSHKNNTKTFLEINIHKSEHHKNKTKQHKHEVITFLDKILEGSDQNNIPSKVPVVTRKIDKHLSNYEFEFIDDSLMLLPLDKRLHFSRNKNDVCKGYLTDSGEPPKV